jgi:hypothetical protein
MMGEVTKILPVLAGGGSSTDQLMPMLMGMMSKDKEGFGGGMGLLVILILFLAISRGGLLGCENGNKSGTSAINCEGFMQILSAINEAKNAVAASTASTATTIDQNAERINANSNMQFINTQGSIAETKTMIANLSNRISDEFREVTTAQTNSTASILAQSNNNYNNLDRSLLTGFNSMDKSIYCSADSIKTQLVNGLNQLQSQSNQQFNALTAQNAQIACGMESGFKEVNCNLSRVEERVLAQGANNTEKILSAIELNAKDAKIAALEARLLETERRNHCTDIDIMIGNKLNSMIGSRINWGNGNPGNGNGNS